MTNDELKKIQEALGTTAKPIMNINHPKWDEFITKMMGSDGCNFQGEAAEDFTFTCFHDGDFRFAKKFLEELGCDTDKSLEYFQSNGGMCDCEIIWNVERSAKGFLKHESL